MPDPAATRHYQLMLQLDKLGLSIAEHLGADPVRIVESLRAVVQLEDRLEPWDMITPFIDGVELPLPTVGTVNGLDTGLFYRNHINMVWGDDGQGKSLLIDQVTFVERRKGHKVMILESEELTPLTRVARWEDQSDHHQRITPEDVAGVIVFPVHRTLTDDNVGMFATIIKAEDVSVVFIDSLGTMMANMGLDENKASDVYKVKSQIFDPLAATGAAVVVVDHVTKSEGEKSKSIGSTRKRSILSGVGYELRVPEGGGFSRKRAGQADLICWKDRQGTYNRGEHVAVVWVTPSAINGWLQIDVEAPEDLVADAPLAENRQAAARDIYAEAWQLLKDNGPLRSKALKTFLRLETEKQVDDVMKAGRDAGDFTLTKEGWALSAAWKQHDCNN